MTPSVTIAEPSLELWSLLDRTGFAISRLRLIELHTFGLTIEQASILHVLSNYGGSMTAGDLEELTLRQHHSISVLVKGMVKSGLVVKNKKPSEKRHTIAVTETGQTLFKKVTVTSLELLYSTLSEGERTSFSQYLYSLQEQARKMLGVNYTNPSIRFFDGKKARIVQNLKDLSPGLPLHELWSLLDRTRFAVSRLRELELAGYGLTIEQASILLILQNCGGVTTARDIEDFTMRRQNSVSVLIKGMIKNGFLEKERKIDEKRFAIRITEKGNSLYQTVPLTSLASVFSVLSAQDSETLAVFLNQLLTKARYLLGVSVKPPLMQYLSVGGDGRQLK